MYSWLDLPIPERTTKDEEARTAMLSESKTEQNKVKNATEAKTRGKKKKKKAHSAAVATVAQSLLFVAAGLPNGIIV